MKLCCPAKFRCSHEIVADRPATISREKQNIKTEVAVEKLQLFCQNSDYEVYHNCRIKRDMKLFGPTDPEVLSLEEK